MISTFIRNIRGLPHHCILLPVYHNVPIAGLNHAAYEGLMIVHNPIENGILWRLQTKGGPGSSVGIATAYGLDRPGIESRWGEIFRDLPALRPTQPPVQWVPGLSRW